MLESVTPAVLFSATSAAVAVTGAIGGFIAYRIKAAAALTTELSSKLSRKEHEQICDRANNAIQEKLDLIVDSVTQGNVDRKSLADFVVSREDLAIAGREKVNAELAAIQLKLAVITATAQTNATNAAATAVNAAQFAAGVAAAQQPVSAAVVVVK